MSHQNNISRNFPKFAIVGTLFAKSRLTKLIFSKNAVFPDWEGDNGFFNILGELSA
jgi:hypothetical protein